MQEILSEEHEIKQLIAQLEQDISEWNFTKDDKMKSKVINYRRCNNHDTNQYLKKKDLINNKLKNLKTSIDRYNLSIFELSEKNISQYKLVKFSQEFFYQNI